MSSFTITVPRLERPISEILSRMPRSFREQAERGFAVLADVSSQHYAGILQAVLVGLETKQAPLEELQKTLKLPTNDLNALFSAAMLTVPMIGEGAEPAEFLSGAVKQGLVSQNIVVKIQPFIDAIVAQRAQIARSIRRTALPAQVLPYVSNVEIVIDLRMGFENVTVQEAVPVAVVHIDTDVDGQEVWFQASKQQMLQLKADIDEAIKRMDAADAWGQKESKG
jgi:hypothetical protein